MTTAYPAELASIDWEAASERWWQRFIEAEPDSEAEEECLASALICGELGRLQAGGL